MVDWQWLGCDAIRDQTFEYYFPHAHEKVLFALSPIYTQRHWQRFIVPQIHRVKAKTLCASSEGRNVEMVQSGSLQTTAKYRVVLTARHHACETMGSCALEGFLSYPFSSTEQALWLNENVEFLTIPFFNKDGVENGDQGKNRSPRDHDRDYDGKNLYPETAALQELIPRWSDYQLNAAFDFHCPGIRGDNNETLYMVGSAEEHIWREQQTFSSILEESIQGTLPFLAEDNIPFGTSWNVGSNYDAGKDFSRWITENTPARLVTTVEIPYANVRGKAVTPETARELGRDLAESLALYLNA